MLKCCEIDVVWDLGMIFLLGAPADARVQISMAEERHYVYDGSQAITQQFPYMLWDGPLTGMILFIDLAKKGGKKL